jgi:hypothetical protein
LSRIDALNAHGDVDSSGGTMLFPTILLSTETRSHYILELVGAQPTFTGLTLKRHREKSANRYLSQFKPHTSDPMFIMDASRIEFGQLTLSLDVDRQTVADRFPFVRFFPTSGLRGNANFTTIFTFGRHFRAAAIHNCLLINKFEAAIRVKHILHVAIVAKSLPRGEYEDWLQGDMLSMGQQEIKGVHTCAPGRRTDFILASQFANMYLSNFKETTIGEFLKNHPSIITQALGAQRFEYEPIFPWLEGRVGPDLSINPDLIIQRNDGTWDIYELKTAALTKDSITKGPRRRRRFIDYVAEGVAQLAHYEEFFSYKRNADYAWKNYGIRIEKPNLVLVVGNFDNADAKAVQEASRQLRNLSIIDYDTLLQMFLSAGRIGTSDPELR